MAWYRESRRHSLASKGVKTAIAKSDAINKLDLKKYSGVWYEHSRYPNWFQKDCDQAKARYVLKGDRYKVINSCKTPDGVDVAEGDAVVTGKKTLGVSFGFFAPRSPYKVEYVSPDYEYAVVGHPNKKYLWILSRNKSITKKKLDQLKLIAKSKGYGLRKLKDVGDY